MVNIFSWFTKPLALFSGSPFVTPGETEAATPVQLSQDEEKAAKVEAMKSSMAQALAEYGATYDEDPDAAERAAEVLSLPIVRLANSIVQWAIKERASHIHYEPDGKGVRVRFRIDGLLQEIMQVPKFVQEPLKQRFKVMAEFDLATHRGRPQQGAFGCRYLEKDYSLHVDAVPSRHGEKLILAIFDLSRVMMGLNRLGFTAEVHKQLEALASQKSGPLLFAGPSGSGRRTTQYTLLNKLNSVEKSILTVEARTTYEMVGLIQIDLARTAAWSRREASAAARDVDVVYLEGIDSVDSADLALSAAEAGQLVLCSVNAPDACSALRRLIEFGVSPERTTRALNGVLAQRLVRRLCQHCREPYEVDAIELRRFGFRPKDPGQKVTLVRGKGCDQCRLTGFHGQMGLFELLTMNVEIGMMLEKQAAPELLLEAAKANVMHVLREDGLIKCLEGITTPDEVLRVLRW